ncbi:MAG: hypothetical protein ILA15_11320 [Clostridiales bacterium]|nr:hypothetical protein [Clostridiales bacterium]
MSELIIIYGFFAAFICVGVLFLLQGGFFLKRYRRSVEENMAEDHAAAFGAPWTDVEPGRLAGDRRARSLSKTYIKLGVIFAGIGLIGIIVFTVTHGV